jgi:hypothetical protein
MAMLVCYFDQNSMFAGKTHGSKNPDARLSVAFNMTFHNFKYERLAPTPPVVTFMPVCLTFSLSMKKSEDHERSRKTT